SVALSADGNTAFWGGFLDNSSVGAAWAFTRSGTTWSQQGRKLVGTGMTINSGSSKPNFGLSVSLSADGNTAAVGAPYDNSNTGAAWIFTRSGGAWSQYGSKLAAADEVVQSGISGFVKAVALSAEGKKLMA